MRIGFFIPARRSRSRVKPVRLPACVDRKLLYLRPTRHGLLFIFILAAMLIASANYSNNIGFLMTFLLGSMAVVSLVHTFVNLAGLRINVKTAEPVFAGERISFPVTVQAGPRVRKSLSIAFGAAPVEFSQPQKGGELCLHLLVGAGTRGLFSPGPLSIFSSYPFGLFEAATEIEDSEIRCLVYPEPVIDTGTHSKSPFTGEEDDSSRAATDNFMGFNPYQPGDEIRHIYWKAYSRGQGLFVREFGRQQGEAIVLDWYSLPSGDTELKLSQLCEMVLKADALNIEYGLRLPGKNIAANAGEVHKRQCLKALALHPADGFAMT